MAVDEELDVFGAETAGMTVEKWKESAEGKELLYGVRISVSIWDNLTGSKTERETETVSDTNTAT